jgi:hypothetical protein
MHIEKNVFENIFNTVMDVKGKTKDNIKARLDVALFCNRKNMELVCDGSRVAKPRASFVLEKNAQLLVYKWLKSLRFPDGHASNIYRRNITRRYLTESCKKITGLCHIHRRVFRRSYRRTIPMESPTDYAHPEAHACLTRVRLHTYRRLYRRLLPTDLCTSRSARMCDTCLFARIPTDRKVWQDF